MTIGTGTAWGKGAMPELMSDSEAQRDNRYGPRHLVGAMAGNWASSAIWWVEPLLIRELAIDRGFGEASAGFLIFIELALMALGSALLTRFVPANRLARAATIGIVIAILSSLLSLEIKSFALLVVARGIAGIGEGAALMMSNSVAAGFDDPDRAFGKITVVNILFGVVLIPASGALTGWFPVLPSYAAILATLVTALVAILTMPPTGKRAAGLLDSAVEPIAWPQKRNIWLVAVATFLIGIASGTMWAFYAVIGERAGLTTTEINTAVSASVFAGLVGAGFASLIGSRFGRLGPLCTGILVMAAAIMVLSFRPTRTNFRIATCVNVGCLYFLVPYFLGTGSAQHWSGRGASYVGSAFYLTGALGPITGGVLTETIGLQTMGLAVLVLASMSIAIFVWVSAAAGKEKVSSMLPAAS